MPILLKMTAGCALALVTTAILTSVTIWMCRRYGWVSEPRPDRWHCGRPAFFGGVPIWLGFVVVSLWLLPITNALAWKVMGVSSLMFVLGLTDDLCHLRARQKLVLQIGVASLALAGGMEFGILENGWVEGALSLFWIVAITNSFNLLDNMDGLSPGVALITSIFLAIYFCQTGNHVFCQFTLLLAGSVAGFLLFNYHPARIFMGDCGSLFLGFILASLSLVLAGSGRAPSSDFFSLLILFGVPIIDTFLVSVTRRLRGQAISQGGTDHCSHRLVRLGLRDSQAVLLLYAASASCGAVALLTRSLGSRLAWWLAGLWALILMGSAAGLFRRTESAYRLDTARQPIFMQEAGSAD